jgi:hypothetical protein
MCLQGLLQLLLLVLELLQLGTVELVLLSSLLGAHMPAEGTRVVTVADTAERQCQARDPCMDTGYS